MRVLGTETERDSQKTRFWRSVGYRSKRSNPVTDFIFMGSKITADGDYSHEIKRRLFLGRKAMTNLDRMLKAKTSLY